MYSELLKNDYINGFMKEFSKSRESKVVKMLVILGIEYAGQLVSEKEKKSQNQWLKKLKDIADNIQTHKGPQPLNSLISNQILQLKEQIYTLNSQLQAQ